MPSRRVWIVLVVCLLVVTGLWFCGGDRASDRSSPKVIEDAKPAESQAKQPTGIDPRRVDSAAHREFLVAANADERAVQKAAADSEELLGLLVGEYAAFAALDAWSQVGAGPDEFGQKILGCQLEFEGALTEACSWEHDVVLRRASDETGEVVGIAVRNTDTEPEIACQRMAECFSRAWIGRAGPMPRAWGKDLISFSSGGSPPTRYAFDATVPEKLAHYEAALREARELLQETLDAMSRSEGTPQHHADQHNAEVYASMVRHIEAMLEALRRGT